MRVFLCCLVGLMSAGAMADGFKVGSGRVVITPDFDMWLGGYAGRTEPSQGKLHDIWAKALVIEDETGQRFAILTTDLLGLPRSLSTKTAALVEERFNIPRASLMLTSSHTHSGPVVRDNLDTMYGLSEEQTALVAKYTAALPDKFLDAIGQAVADLAPATLEWGKGTAGFAINRREFTPGGVQLGVNPIGPVDHDVPMLVVKKDGKLDAVLFGYACHNTTLGIQQINGDYAGFCQAYLEEAMPDVTALFVTGCGADANPYPRGKIDLAMDHGHELADAVMARLKEPFELVEGPIRAVFNEVPLPLSEPPTREDLEKQLEDENKFIQRRAGLLLKTFDANGGLDTTYPYPIQVWQFGDGLQMTALGGEVVVDYDLLMKYEYGDTHQWTIGYANDVMAYIPTVRILREGGYEADTSMIYYGFYGPWSPELEHIILKGVRDLVGREQAVSFLDGEAMKAQKPMLIAHRGGVISEQSPECSASAIRLAAQNGYGAVELDLRANADNHPYIFHDGKTEKACGVAGDFSAMKDSDINALRYTANGEPVLSFAEALVLCRDLGLGIMLDIKSPENEVFLRAVARTLDREGFNDSTICINGDERVRAALDRIARLRVLDDEMNAVLAGTKPDLSRRFWFGLPENLPVEAIGPLQEAGALVIPGINTFRYNDASYLADGERDIAGLTAAGVDGFQIDSVYQHALGRPQVATKTEH